MKSILRLSVTTLVAALLVAHCAPHSEPPAAAPAQPATAQTTLNVLLITLDTTRADHLGCYGAEHALTPALDALAARGTLFEQAFTSCPQTLPAHATILTGRQPPEHGLRSNGKNRLGDSVPTLAETLAQHGYQTAAFVAAFVLNSKFGLNRGFQTYDDDLSAAPKQEVVEPLSVYRQGNVVTNAALKWLEQHVPAHPSAVSGQQREGEAPRDQPSAIGDQPFFAWVHLYDPHYPYFAHSELAGTAFEGVASYDGEVAFMDRQVGRLLEFLDQHDLRARTLVIALADHGEGLEDHGEIEHGYLLNHEVLHVPLIVSLPGTVRDGRRVGALVSIVDLFPTVLDVVGMPAAVQGLGRSLAPALRGQPLDSRPSYAETELPYSVYGWSPLRSLTTDHWKYIRSTRPELYDRTTDLKEIYNLAGARPSQTNELEVTLASLEAPMARQSAPAVALSDTDKARLESLGYKIGAHDTPAAATTPSPASGGERQTLKDIKDMLGVKRLDTRLTRGLAFGTLTPAEQIEIARELVRVSPETASFHGRLGSLLLTQGELAEAVTALSEAVRLQPDLAEAHVNLGMALARQDKLDDAVKAYGQALRADPDYVEAYFRMGNVLADKGTLDEALGFYAEAVRRKPDFAEAYFNMGNTLARRNKVEPAIAAYRDALRIRPGYAEVRFNLANLLREHGQLDEAIEQYEQALQAEPDNIDIRNNFGVTLAARGRRDEAMAQYREALKRKPDFARAHHNLGNALAEAGQFSEAIRHHREAVRLRPEEPEFANGLAWLLATCADAKERDAKRAVELAEKACALTDRGDARLLTTLAAAYAEAHRLDDAVHTMTRALQVAQANGSPGPIKDIRERLTIYQTQLAAH